MKTSAMNGDSVEFAGTSNAAADDSLLASVKRAIDGFRHANANRRMRRDLADLDDSILRDIGVATDEIHRVRAGDEFTPRSWRA